MAKRFEELSVDQQEDFKRRAIAGDTPFKLSELFDVSYFTARTNRERIREEYRAKLPKED